MKYTKNWYHSDNIWKRRIASYFGKIKGYLTYRPLKVIGTLLGFLLSKMPTIFASSIKQSLILKTSMPMSLNIKVVVDRAKDISRAQFCNKERLTCEWIEKHYKKGDVIYDIGANIGAVSLISAAYLEKDCLIYSFEPVPSTFNMLFKNIMLNDFDKVIVPLNIALSDKVQIDNFNLTSLESGTSGHSVDGAGVLSNFSKRLTVLTQTLDNLIDSYNLKIANHLKIDVDGIDYRVLLGGENSILKNPKLKTILIEKNDNEGNIRLLLQKHGFIEVELIDNKKVYGNLGFVRN
jgi:FkbM family methyltransferase